MYLVCGEALFDMFLDGEGRQGSLHFDAHVGGSPFNVAIGIARLGGESALFTGVSEDMFGQRLMNTLEQEQVSTRYIVRSGRRTTLSMVGTDSNGHPSYVFYGLGSADCSVTTEDVPSIGQEISGFHFGSYSLVVQPVADALASIASMADGRLVSVDPNIRPTVEPDLDIWRKRVAQYAAIADLIKISSEDLEFLYPGIKPETKAIEWLALGANLVIVTDGGEAVHAWTRSGLYLEEKPFASEVIDTVGAGDSFQSALLYRLNCFGEPKQVVQNLDEEQLGDLLQFSMRAASVTCSRRGADLPRLNEISTGGS